MSAFVLPTFLQRLLKFVKELKTPVKEFQNLPADFTGLSKSQRLPPRNSKFLSTGTVIVEVTRFVTELKILVKEIKDSCQG